MTQQAYYGEDYPEPGTPVPTGAELIDFRGGKALFVKVAREAQDNSTGRVAVQGAQGYREFFPGVYGLEIR